MEFQPLIDVFVTSDVIELSVAAGILEAAGLEPRLRDLTVRPYPVSIGPLGEKRIAVPPDQARLARELLGAALADGALTCGSLLADKREGKHSGPE
jgi:hypothetical protein